MCSDDWRFRLTVCDYVLSVVNRRSASYANVLLVGGAGGTRLVPPKNEPELGDHHRHSGSG